MGPDEAPVYAKEQLHQVLREAKVTQQSIQAASHWMLARRAAVDAMAADWAALLQAADPAQQVVYLYVANDALQVGGRKYGRSIAASFAPRLLEAAQFVMAAGDEKVKRCLMKVVGVWAERKVVPLTALEQLQRVCAGKPAMYVAVCSMCSFLCVLSNLMWCGQQSRARGQRGGRE